MRNTVATLQVLLSEVVTILLLNGCGSVGKPYRVPPIFSDQSGLTTIDKHHQINPRLYKATKTDDERSLYEMAVGTDADEAKKARNLLQARIISLSDCVTEDYLSGIFGVENLNNVGLGITTVALDSIGTAVSPASTKTVLSAGAAITGSSRAIINEEIFANAFASAITRAIHAARKARALELQVKRREQSILEYSVEDAICDATTYHEMGSFYYGLELIQKASDRDVNDIEKSKIHPLEEKLNLSAYSSDAAMRAKLNGLLKRPLKASAPKKKDGSPYSSADEYAKELATKMDPPSNVIEVRLGGGERLRALIDELEPVVDQKPTGEQ